jgi:cobalt-zinc-cadmium efflux system membrane fusion protein
MLAEMFIRRLPGERLCAIKRCKPLASQPLVALASCLAFGFSGIGCKGPKSDPQAEAPPPVKVEEAQHASEFAVERPERFQLAKAVAFSAVSELRVTGAVNPDVSRNVPVISLASGRVVEIKARLGDSVKKGQVLLTVQSADISGAYSDYLQATADEALAAKQLDRSRILFDHGAIAKTALEIAETAEDKAKVTVKTTLEHLHVLGATPDHPSPIIEIKAPVSGVITDQQVTSASGVQALSIPNPFTISDLTHVWIVCDVFENDLAGVHLGERAEIRLNAYPDKLISGVISNIGPILDPNIRTAKVRIEVENPGVMRVGMFVTAIFRGIRKETRTAVPASAIVHLQDRDWVYVPVNNGRFRRVEVVGGAMIPGDRQEILSGLAPGQAVIANALQFQNEVQR